jgi:hypothetical protein
MKAIQIEAFGNPAEVVKAVDIPDVGAPVVGADGRLLANHSCDVRTSATHLSRWHDKEKQCLFAFWAMRAHMEDVAIDATERIFRACAQLQDPQYRDVCASARLAVHIAQIGIYAIVSNAQPIFRAAVERYATLRRTFRERYLDFGGDFESAERELIEEGETRLMIDPHDREFFSTVTPNQIRTCFASLKWAAVAGAAGGGPVLGGRRPMK